jgi:hypothetical protein
MTDKKQPLLKKVEELLQELSNLRQKADLAQLNILPQTYQENSKQIQAQINNLENLKKKINDLPEEAKPESALEEELKIAHKQFHDLKRLEVPLNNLPAAKQKELFDKLWQENMDKFRKPQYDPLYLQDAQMKAITNRLEETSKKLSSLLKFVQDECQKAKTDRGIQTIYMEGFTALTGFIAQQEKDWAFADSRFQLLQSGYSVYEQAKKSQEEVIKTAEKLEKEAINLGIGESESLIRRIKAHIDSVNKKHLAIDAALSPSRKKSNPSSFSYWNFLSSVVAEDEDEDLDFFSFLTEAHTDCTTDTEKLEDLITQLESRINSLKEEKEKAMQIVLDTVGKIEEEKKSFYTEVQRIKSWLGIYKVDATRVEGIQRCFTNEVETRMVEKSAQEMADCRLKKLENLRSIRSRLDALKSELDLEVRDAIKAETEQAVKDLLLGHSSLRPWYCESLNDDVAEKLKQGLNNEKFNAFLDALENELLKTDPNRVNNINNIHNNIFFKLNDGNLLKGLNVHGVYAIEKWLMFKDLNVGILKEELANKLDALLLLHVHDINPNLENFSLDSTAADAISILAKCDQLDNTVLERPLLLKAISGVLRVLGKKAETPEALETLKAKTPELIKALKEDENKCKILINLLEREDDNSLKMTLDLASFEILANDILTFDKSITKAIVDLNKSYPESLEPWFLIYAQQEKMQALLKHDNLISLAPFFKGIFQQDIKYAVAQEYLRANVEDRLNVINIEFNHRKKGRSLNQQLELLIDAQQNPEIKLGSMATVMDHINAFIESQTIGVKRLLSFVPEAISILLNEDNDEIKKEKLQRLASKKLPTSTYKRILNALIEVINNAFEMVHQAIQSLTKNKTEITKHRFFPPVNYTANLGFEQILGDALREENSSANKSQEANESKTLN